jgi:hypothetical protein
MATRQEIQAKLDQIEQRKAEALKALQLKRAKLKAKLAQLDRPSKSQRRLDARRKILLGAFILEQLEHAGSSPQALTFEGKRFFDWLVRPNDRAVFETPSDVQVPALPAATATGNGEAAALAPPTAATANPRVATADTPLNVPFADKDQAKALGATWQPDQKRWVVPKGRDLALFQSWLP